MAHIASTLKRAFERHGEHGTITTGDTTWSFEAIDRAASSIAAALVARGVRAGDRVAVVAPNSTWCVASYLGVWKMGGITVGINPLLTVPEIEYIVGHAAPRAAFVSAPKLADARAANGAAGGPITSWLVEGTCSDPDALAVSDLPAAAVVELGADRPDTATLLYTSGTTGRPKGVMLTHDNVLWAERGWREAFVLGPDDVFFCGLPLFHCYGLIVLLSCLVAGTPVALEVGFPFPRVLDRLAGERVTVFPSVPPVFQAIAALHWDDAQYDFSSLRLLVNGAAPISEETIRKVRARLGGPVFRNAYGATETGTLISMSALDIDEPPASVGAVAPQVEVSIHDDVGRQLAPYEHGEIWVKSPGVMQGYYEDPEATADAIVDAWYKTGDVGYFDGDGFLYISDRIKDLIIVNGQNVYPKEIEDAILSFPGTARAAVVRMQVEDTNEAPTAFVVPIQDAEISIPQLLAFLRTRLADYKLPRKIRIVDSLPTSASGKLLKRVIQAQ